MRACPDMYLRCVNCQHVVSVPDGFGRYFDMPVRCHACRRVFTVLPRARSAGQRPRAPQGGALTGPRQREGTIISSVRLRAARSVCGTVASPCAGPACVPAPQPVFDTGHIGMPTGLMW